MFRYSKQCPDCEGLGWHPCAGCADPEGLPCISKDSCPFPGCSKEGRIPCERCAENRDIVITERTNSVGELISEETPLTIKTWRHSWYCNMDDFLPNSYEEGIDDPRAADFEMLVPEDLMEEVNSGIITDPVLLYGIPRERYFSFGLRAVGEKQFFFIAGDYGCYFPVGDRYVHVNYDDIHDVTEYPDRLVIKYTADEEEKEWEHIELPRTQENQVYIRSLRLSLQQVIKKERNYGYDGQSITLWYVLEQFVGKLSNQGKERRFEPGTHYSKRQTPREKWIRKILFSYGAKIRRSQVVALVDTTVEGAEERGILFGQDGLAFSNGKNFGYIPYANIRYMSTDKMKTKVMLHGYFDECLHICKQVAFDQTEYHIEMLEVCFETLLRHV